MAAHLAFEIVGRLKSGVERDIGLHDLPGGLVRHTNYTRFGDRRVLDQCRFHFERANQVTGSLDEVVGTADKPVIPVIVTHREIARQIPVTGETLLKARLLVQIRAHHGRPPYPERQLADLAGAEFGHSTTLIALALENASGDPGHRFAHGPGLDRHARLVGDHDPAGFRLPPVVMERLSENLLAPDNGLGVQRLANAGHEPERGEIVGSGLFGTRAHHHADRRGRGIPDFDLLFPDRVIPAVEIEFGLVNDHGHPVHQRRDDPLGGSGNPSRVRRAPVDRPGREVQGVTA